jgi:hypothetical protein
MAYALLFGGQRRESRSRAQLKGTFLLALDLIAPALLLGLWRVWSSALAPKLSFYFTAEVLLIVYAYFAVVRTTHVAVRSFDQTGAYSRSLAVAAAQTFHRGVRPYWIKIAIVCLSLLLGALALDMLTTGTGLQRRPNLHLTILFLEIMIWARYGAAIVIAAACWSPSGPPAFAEARELADRPDVARSFALTNVAFGAIALAGVAAYKWGGALLPTARAELFCSAALFASLAFLALWLQCRWVRKTVVTFQRQRSQGLAMPVLQRAA